MISLAYSMFREAFPTMDFWDTVLGRDISLVTREDNEATIKVVKKGYSAKLRHVSRTHKVNLGSLYELFHDPKYTIEHVGTNDQCADIFTKGLEPYKWDNAISLLNMQLYGG